MYSKPKRNSLKLRPNQDTAEGQVNLTTNNTIYKGDDMI